MDKEITIRIEMSDPDHPMRDFVEGGRFAKMLDLAIRRSVTKPVRRRIAGISEVGDD